MAIYFLLVAQLIHRPTWSLSFQSAFTCGAAGEAEAIPARELEPLLSWTGLTWEARGPGAAPNAGLGSTFGNCPGGCDPTSGDDWRDCFGSAEDVEPPTAAAAGGSVLCATMCGATPGDCRIRRDEIGFLIPSLQAEQLS